MKAILRGLPLAAVLFSMALLVFAAPLPTTPIGLVKITDGANIAMFDPSGNVLVREGHQANLAAASNGGAQANNCTLTGAANVTTYLAGFYVSGLGATSGSTVAVTITGTGSANTPTFYVTIPAGATTAITPLNIWFDKPIPASAANTSIVVNVPSFGTGNTTAAAVAWGFRQ